MKVFSLKYLKALYRRILQSIAFYPVLISFIFFLIAVISLSIENIQLVEGVKKKFSYLFIQDAETSRTILSTLITGILSLTVFSFSMVMVVLNQASVNFSPRLLPGLISSKKHQFILGVYIGTLLYCIMVMIALGAYGINENNLGFTTMLSALFGVTCIGFFVYFIHSISGAIQIQNIIDAIFTSSMETLDNLSKKNQEAKVDKERLETATSYTILYSSDSGFFKEFDKDLLADTLKELPLTIEVIPFKDAHVWEGHPVAKVDRQLDQKEIEDLLHCFSISKSRFSGNSIYSNLSKLMEVAVKALSPGVNDPGTAMDVIHVLAPLILKSLTFPTAFKSKMTSHNIIVIENNMCAKVLMTTIIQPIREYAKSDSAVMACLVGALQFISSTETLELHDKKQVELQLQACKNDIEHAITNAADRDELLAIIRG